MTMQWAAILMVLAVGVPAFAGGRGSGPVGNPLTVNRGAVSYGTGVQVPLSEDYAILGRSGTSIFASNRDIGGGGTQGPTTMPGGGGARVASRAPSPVVRGVMFDDSGPMALLEVVDIRGITLNVYVRPGQTYQEFTVTGITLDGLELTSRAGARVIPLGHALDGMDGSALPTTSSYQSADASGTGGSAVPGTAAVRGRQSFRDGATAGPLGTAGAVGNVPSGVMVNPSLDPPLPPGSTDDLAARMAQRRQVQLGAASSVGR